MSARRRRLRVLHLFARLTLVGILAWAAAGVLAAWALLRREPPFEEPPPSGSPWPVAALRLTASDGVELGAWFFEGSRADRPAVLVLHGRSGSRSRNRWHEQRLVELGSPVLSLTLRGHGDSGGERLGFGWDERLDVLAGVAELERRLPGRRIAIVGTSLGAAATLFAARELAGRIEGAFLDSPYLELERAVRLRCEAALWAPFDLLAFEALWTAGRRVLDFQGASERPLDHLAFLPAELALVFVSGGADRVHPPEDLSEFGRRAGPTAEVHIVPGASHALGYLRAPAEYRRLLEAFLERVGAVGGAAAPGR